ncbi:tail fiber domain-containing protein, partial [Candidatus Pacearchaeota archaeon]|nr:tail fiber domain-containing protein [Candidatus Pacearchaeota archaeon]
EDNVCSTAYGTCLSDVSDIRLKTITENITGILDKLETLQTISFNWNEEGIKLYPGNNSNSSQVGLIAQDVQKVFPEFVKQGSDGYLRLNYGQLSSVLVGGINELNEKTNLSINNLTMQVFDIKGNILTLQKENSNLKDENLKLKNDTELMKQDLCSLGIKRWC